MAASTEKHDAMPNPQFDERLCEIEATCTTGFEEVVQNDLEEKLGAKVIPAKGKVTVFVPFKDVTKLLKLYSVDNLYVVMKHYKEFRFEDEKDAAMTQLKGIVPELDWEFGLAVWSKFISFAHPVSHLPQKSAVNPEADAESEHTEGSKEKPMLVPEVGDVDAEGGASEGHLHAVPVPDKLGKDHDEDTGPAAKKQIVSVTSVPPPVSKLVYNPLMPLFRATCYRSGTNHSFGSPDAARNFGGSVQDYFGWNVKMKNFDVEVVINIDDDHIYVCLALTKESLHRRHIVDFGLCTLRPTIAYSMLRLCDIQPGEIVCDPMCGGGSIPIEAAVSWPCAIHMGGDIQRQSPPRTLNNVQTLNQKRTSTGRAPIAVNVVRWDATQLPLSDESVDVFISDMPFGKRSGSKTNNMALYPRLLADWARVCRPVTGRACLLTQDRTSITKTMSMVGNLWSLKRTVFINIGGIIAGVFLLSRTAEKMTNAHCTESKTNKRTELS